MSLSLSDLRLAFWGTPSQEAGILQQWFDEGRTASGLFPQVVRETTGSVAAADFVVITLNWPTAFSDTNYTVVVSVQDDEVSDMGLRVVRIQAKVVGSISVVVENTAISARTGVIEAMAFVD